MERKSPTVSDVIHYGRTPFGEVIFPPSSPPEVKGLIMNPLLVSLAPLYPDYTVRMIVSSLQVADFDEALISKSVKFHVLSRIRKGKYHSARSENIAIMMEYLGSNNDRVFGHGDKELQLTWLLRYSRRPLCSPGKFVRAVLDASQFSQNEIPNLLGRNYNLSGSPEELFAVPRMYVNDFNFRPSSRVLAPEFEMRDLNNDDLPQIIPLKKRHYPHHGTKSRDMLALGPHKGIFLKETNQLLAKSGMICSGELPELGKFSVLGDTVTHTDWRGNGFMSILISSSTSDALSRGFTYVVADGNSPDSEISLVNRGFQTVARFWWPKWERKTPLVARIKQRFSQKKQ